MIAVTMFWMILKCFIWYSETSQNRTLSWCAGPKVSEWRTVRSFVGSPVTKAVFPRQSRQNSSLTNIENKFLRTHCDVHIRTKTLVYKHICCECVCVCVHMYLCKHVCKSGDQHRMPNVYFFPCIFATCAFKLTHAHLYHVTTHIHRNTYQLTTPSPCLFCLLAPQKYILPKK